MKKLFPYLSILAIGVFFFGLVWSDPFNSKTQGTNESDAINPVIPVTNAIVKFVDNMDGANDTVALRTRGWKPKRGPAGGPAGTSPNWFQGNSTVFAAFEGPATGYVAANFNNVTGTNPIDLWLISPVVNGASGDTVSFYERSPTGSTFPDSIRVYWASNGDTVPGSGSWVEIGRFKTTVTGSWAERRFTLPSAGATGRFAINYRVVNGGPSGANSDYVGVDFIRLLGPAPVVTCNVTANQWTTRPVVPNAAYFGNSAWIGDTLYFQAPSSAGAATTTIYRYTYNGSWSTGVPMPGALVGGSMVSAGGKLYYIGGSSTGITTGGTTVYSYTPGAGWTTMAPLPAALSGHQAVNWGDSVIVVVGGPYTGSGTNLAHHYYRIGSNTWGTTAASLPSGTGRRTFAMGINGNKIIISGGFNTAFLKTTYVGTIGANASAITWVAAPDIPTSESGLSRPGGTSFGNWFFLVGGERGTTTGYSDITYVFNATSNTWSGQISGLPFPRSNIMGHITAKCINDTLSLFCPAGYGIVGGIGTGAATDIFHITRAGVFTSTGNNTTIAPDKFELSQNYPNPFNPSTVINFSLPKSSLVTLKVYDITGKEVKTLVNELRSAGRYDVTFDASNFATGVYFYTLETENFTQTKKMLLVK
jgi:hypothetical protein